MRPDSELLANTAADLDAVGGVLRGYLTMPMKPWPDSPASRERARQSDFAALPFDTPVVHAQVAPLQYLGVASDHLTAMAALLRTPGTVMALLTVLRTLIVGAAYASYLADADIDLQERMRRVLNCELDSLTEQMRLVGRDDTERAAEFDRLDERRQEIKRGARTCGWTVKGNDTPKRKAWPSDWSIEPHSSEMSLVSDLIGSATEAGSPGRTLYRYLSATAHAQPHGLLGLVVPEHTVSNGDGSATAGIGMSHRQLLILAMTAIGTLTTSMDRCIRYYAWEPAAWTAEVVPLFNDIRQSVGMPVQSSGALRRG